MLRHVRTDSKRYNARGEPNKYACIPTQRRDCSADSRFVRTAFKFRIPMEDFYVIS